jgi:type II secretory pathway pseudopilin PulG
MRFHKSTNGQFGLTLVELIIAFALLGILIVFVLGISTMVLGLTAKMQTKNIALSLAQEKIEELRGTKNLIDPPSSTPRPGYTLSVNSTPFGDYLRKVIVTVQGPPGLSTRTVTLETLISTNLPNVGFIFSSNGEDYVRREDGLVTTLVASIRDDGHDIPLANVKYLESTDLGNNWSAPQTMPIYTNKEFTTLPVTTTLNAQTTYYGKYAVSGDGSTLDIQILVTNTASQTNYLPAGPYPASPWLRLTTDNEPPSSLMVSGTLSYFQTTLSPTVSASDSGSGVGRCFLSFQRLPDLNYLADDGETWTSSTVVYQELSQYPEGVWNISLPLTVVTAVPTGNAIAVKAYVIDRVIGESINFGDHIPTNGAFGQDNQAWPGVNANFAQSDTMTTTRAFPPTVTTLTATAATPTSWILSGRANPQGAPTTCWFEWGRLDTPGTRTPTQFVGSDATDHDFSATITLTETGTYFFQAWAQNESVTPITPTPGEILFFYVPKS